jgi:hypothetical protein
MMEEEKDGPGALSFDLEKWHVKGVNAESVPRYSRAPCSRGRVQEFVADFTQNHRTTIYPRNEH